MTQDISAGRIAGLLFALILVAFGFMWMDHEGQKIIDANNDPANQTLLQRADKATFIFAYQRNTTPEAMANQVFATKAEFVEMTGNIMFNNPNLEPTEAARAALLEIRRRNLFGQSLQP